MRSHITALGRFMIGLSIIHLLVAICVMIPISMEFSARGFSGSHAHSGFGMLAAITLLGLILSVIALPGMVIGLGVIRNEPWARTWAIIMSILIIFTSPFGALLGIYGLWVMFNPETESIFQTRSVSF